MPEVDRRSLLRVLYLSIFLTSTGLGTSTFLLPVYAETLGATYLDLGRIGAAGNVVYFLGTIVTGLVLDRYERVRLYLGFTLGGAATIFLFTFADSIHLITVMRLLLGFFSAAFWVTASTLTADISPTDRLTQSMGRYNQAWILGFTVGPLIGGQVVNAYGYDVFFLSLAAVIALSFITIFLRMRSRISLVNRSRKEHQRFDRLRGALLGYLTLIPHTLILGIYMAIMPGHMNAVGLTSATIGLLITATNGVRGATFMNVERLVEWGHTRSIAVAASILAASMFLTTRASDTSSFAIPLLLYGIGSGIVTPVALDWITKRTPREILGTAMGVHEGVYGVGMCLGPLAGGFLADTYGPSTLYMALVGVAFVMMPLTWRMKDTG
jgi:MFS family permease